MDNSFIELRGINKTYKLGKAMVPALNNVNFDVNRGEFLVIHGPSGSGKSTLLNIIGCLDIPDSGTFCFAGRNLHTESIAKLSAVRNRQIGFIFQSFNLIPVLSVIENVELPCLIRKDLACRKELRERARQVIAEVGLEKFLVNRPDELSGGQRQRVAIARALITDPMLILADEPTANLDSATGTQILRLMQELNAKKQVTFIFSTHDSKVIELAHRTVEMRDGCLSN